ncbi:head-tail joining protein [Zooshikella sp. RANM57]|uniref:head-tail joining protein n=1 Tax=Zooshikella sp. RANM57 TaxID=3425863 RepID=UPI003D6F924C
MRKSIQLRAFRELLDEFGIDALWLFNDGREVKVRALFVENNAVISASAKRRDTFSQVDVSAVQPVLVLETALIPGAAGDAVIVDSERYTVLPFKSKYQNNVQTHIPLKSYQPNEDNSSWRSGAHGV